MPSIARSAPAGPLYRLRNACVLAARQARADIKSSSPLREQEALARIEESARLFDRYILQIHNSLDIRDTLSFKASDLAL